jgi:hypothetical protein
MFVICNSFGQVQVADSILSVKQGWSEGSIMTSAGEELFGLLRYNDKSGLLSFEDENKSSTYTADGIVAFELFDESIKKQRVFYSFLWEEEEGMRRRLFFEIVMELDGFAILSKVDPIDISHKVFRSSGGFNPATNAYAPASEYGSSVKISQTETIYLMDSETNIKPYIQIIETDIDGVLYNRKKTRNKILDEHLLQQFVGKQMNDKLVEYARQNNLSFKEKEDLIRVFEYYREIRKSE